MLASELAAGDLVVATPGESVARMKIDFALANEASYSPNTIQKVRRSLHATMSCLVLFLIRANQRAAGCS